MRRVNKLHNIPTVVDGIRFASRLEARRYSELKLLEKAGEITDLRWQVPFELIPAQYEIITTDEVYTRGPHKGEHKKKKILLEKPVCYIADFVYKRRKEVSNGLELWYTIVEDTKGIKTKDYIIKRKLMLYIHEIKIQEVTR